MTIEDLKRHCIKTIKMSEAIESIPNVRVTDNRSLQEHKMVLKLIEAWDKVKNDICEIDWYGDDAFWDGVNLVSDIIDKHLSEVSE